MYGIVYCYVGTYTWMCGSVPKVLVSIVGLFELDIEARMCSVVVEFQIRLLE